MSSFSGNSGRAGPHGLDGGNQTRRSRPGQPLAEEARKHGRRKRRPAPGQSGAQLLDPQPQPALDGAFRAIELPGDFFAREATEVTQHDGLALSTRQLVERRVELRPDFVPTGLAGASRCLRVHLPRLPFDAGPAGRVFPDVPRAVAGRAVQPAGQTRAFGQPAPPAQKHQERCLCRILSRVSVAQQAQAGTVDQSCVPPDGLRVEFRGSAACVRGQQFCIGHAGLLPLSGRDRPTRSIRHVMDWRRAIPQTFYAEAGRRVSLYLRMKQPEAPIALRESHMR